MKELIVIIISRDSLLIAFASSIGREQIDDNEYVIMKQLLSNYEAISVREDSAKKIIGSMGYSVTHLLDPTLLLEKEEWKVCTPEELPVENGLPCPPWLDMTPIHAKM